MRFEVLFNVVVRNHSLIGHSNGERWLLTLLDESPTVFDVGFNDGQSTIEILNSRPHANVLGFDPSRFAKEKYREAFSEDERVKLLNVGISDKKGSLTFYDYDNMCNSLAQRKDVAGPPSKSYSVPVETIDSICESEGVGMINFLKIDVEGFDVNVLEGARNSLENQRIDLLAFEFGSGWIGSRRYLWEAVEYMADKPYSLFRLFNGFVVPLRYDYRRDSSATLPAMYVGISDKRLSRGDIPMRKYNF